MPQWRGCGIIMAVASASPRPQPVAKLFARIAKFMQDKS
jgi:hypothetical protein